MKQRNVQRRQALRYLAREYKAGRWWWHAVSMAAECRADGQTRAAWRRQRQVPLVLPVSHWPG